VMDGSGYVAYPELEADTLAFFALPGAVAGAGREGVEPPSHLAAVARNRRILMEVSTSFADAFPDEPSAHRTLARALESAGQLEERMAGVPAARRALMQSALLDVSAELVFDALGLRPAHRTRPPGPRLEMVLQWRLAHGDTASVRTSLDSLERAHGGRLSSG